MFYLGSVGTALGYMMQATVAAWLMATLTPSELMVALVQTASTVPALLFGLAAGALADIVERRTVILATQYALLAATAALGIAGSSACSVRWRCSRAHLIGAGLPSTCLRSGKHQRSGGASDLQRAVGLGIVAFARAVGPALAGAIAAWLGSGALLASALFFSVTIYGARLDAASPPPGVRDTLLPHPERPALYPHSRRCALISRGLSFGVCKHTVGTAARHRTRPAGLGAGASDAVGERHCAIVARRFCSCRRRRERLVAFGFFFGGCVILDISAGA